MKKNDRIENMSEQEAIDRVGDLLYAIYISGDQDECSMKHIGHGTSMLYNGINPSVKDNYLDYSTAGFSYEFSDYDNDILVEGAFQKYIWEEIYQIVMIHGKGILEQVEAPSLYILGYLEDY